MWKVSPLKANSYSLVARQYLNAPYVFNLGNSFLRLVLYHHLILQMRRQRDREVLPKLFS